MASGHFTASPAEMKEIGDQTLLLHGDLSSYLVELAGVRDAFPSVAKGMAAQAATMKLGESIESGQALARTLSQIADDVKAAGVQFDATDFQGKDRIIAQYGQDETASKVDSSTWQ
ncbi:hypothetical protein [Nocardia tengchongensis]|uniref:hypothetical protein n=1 Tax=Nocardia tengchongensis TaxID=2055889 RepID=UPI00360618A6